MFYSILALAAAQAAAPQPAAKPATPAPVAATAPQAAVQPAPAAAIATPAPVAAAVPQPAVQAAPAAPVAAIISPPTQNVLRAGVEVPLRVEEGIDSNNKGMREGQQFHLSVANNVMLGNQIVIPAGSPATAEITDLRRKGMWGKSGHIVARAMNVRVGDRLIRLSGTFDEHGTTGTAGVVAAIAFVPIAGFFMTGTSAKIPAGAGVRAFLDEDLTIAVPVQPAPSVVPTTAPVVAAAPSAPITQASVPAVTLPAATAPAAVKH
jgi:hypothetical protein